MTVADLLLRVVPSAPQELERLGAAVDLARRVQARLNGVFVTSENDNKADWAHALFERAVTRTPLETTWRVIDGRGEGGLLSLARRSDLSILPSAGLIPGPSTRAPCDIGLESGRPVLILPQPRPEISVGNTVVVGWNESREASRAIHDAIPILVQAEKVLILTILAPGELEPLADVRLLEHLRQHGVDAELERRYGDDPAEEIAAEARRMGADMVVVGLRERTYGPPREPPKGLGDVSWRFAHTGSLPVFFSH